MLLMIGGKDAADKTPLADGCEVRMKLHHQVTGRNRFGSVDLNFVVALRVKRRDPEKTGKQEKQAHAAFQNLSVAEKHHEPLIHVVLLVAMEQRHTRIVGGKFHVGLGMRVHQHGVFKHAARWAASDTA